MMFARNFIRAGTACALLSALAWGQPNLTTISDTLFKADGTRFNGLAQFTWLSFDAANGTNIAQQITTVRIIDGNLFVQLTPTTTATPLAEYSVLYDSDGQIQFTETWNVPPSTTPLLVRDVRTSEPLFPVTGGSSGGAGAVTQIQESDVTGLVADLTARPVEGPGYASSRAAVINNSGQIEAAVGTTTNCVHVDGSSGACSSITFVDAETPGGVVDGSNTAFTLANAPSPAGSAVTFLSGATPQPGDALIAEYRH
jgi:hypothetical protein